MTLTAGEAAMITALLAQKLARNTSEGGFKPSIQIHILSVVGICHAILFADKLPEHMLPHPDGQSSCASDGHLGWPGNMYGSRGSADISPTRECPNSSGRLAGIVSRIMLIQGTELAKNSRGSIS